MLSPVAPGVEMVSISIEGIIVEQCPQSGGHWLDAGELAKLARQDTQVEKAVEAVESVSYETTRLCPKDNTPLVEVEFPGYARLRLDICPSCGGIWLDASELSQTLTLLGRPAPPRLAPDASPRHDVPSGPVLRFLARLVRSRAGGS